MNRLVRIIKYDKKYMGDENPDDWGDGGWHLIIFNEDDPRIFCSGIVFLDGSTTVEYETKEVKRGGITCPDCLKKIKNIKAVKL